MKQEGLPRRARLCTRYRRVLRLLEWQTPTDQIMERLDMASHEVSNAARHLRRYGFAVRKRTRHETCALRQARRTRRPCLSCGSIFLSEGKHHRICDSCKSRESWRYVGALNSGSPPLPSGAAGAQRRKRPCRPCVTR